MTQIVAAVAGGPLANVNQWNAKIWPMSARQICGRSARPEADLPFRARK
jgi:hypothetical protein